MAPKIDLDIALAAAEARSLVEESRAEGDAVHIGRLADDLLKSLMTYEDGPHFGLLVIGQLRLIAQEARGEGPPSPVGIDDRREVERPSDQRRAEPRRRYLLSGHLLFPGNENLLAVRVTNLSARGAKLRLGGVHAILDRAKLFVPQLGIAQDVEVVWKELPDFGVRFAQPLHLE